MNAVGLALWLLLLSSPPAAPSRLLGAFLIETLQSALCNLFAGYGRRLQVIMVHMAKQPFEPSLWPFLVLSAGAASGEWLPAAADDPTAAAALLAAATLCGATALYGRYVVAVVREVCAHLNIYCFKIKPAVPPGRVTRSAAKKKA